MVNHIRHFTYYEYCLRHHNKVSNYHMDYRGGRVVLCSCLAVCKFEHRIGRVQNRHKKLKYKLR
jgi:hypothetical protein